MCKWQLAIAMLSRMAAVSFKYWNDCVEPEDLEAMWMEPDVRTEWINVGETKGSRVHLSRDPDGHPYLTQTEMRVKSKQICCWFTDIFI